MECIQCGAELRLGARFCNVCGAEQPPMTAEAETDSQAGDSAGKQKRPPRIPRHRDDETDDSNGADDSPDDHAKMQPEPAASEELDSAVVAVAVAEQPEAESEPVPAVAHADAVPVDKPAEDDGDDGDDGEATMPETPTPLSVADMPTQEHPALPQMPQVAPISSLAAAPQAEPLDEPLPPYDLDETPEQPAQPAMPTPTDGLPWPLPPTIIVGGRYRVEELVRSSQTERGPENVYRARDLQAYEECWSCGAKHDNATALDPYCDQCGADMLSREFVLVERLTSDAGAAEATDATEAETETGARVFTQGLRTYEVAPKPISAIHFPSGVRVSAYVTADHGQTRQGEANEDSTALLVFDAIYNSRHDPHALGIVADGLGGHDSGQDASKLVVQTMLEVLVPALVPAAPADEPSEDSADTSAFDGEKLLRDAARAANDALCAANEAQQADMGSTLVAALIAGDSAWIANMGDSRGYVYDDHGLRRVTKDHSLVEQLIDAGMIPPEERYEHPQRNQILKSLGADPRLEADIFPQELRPGTRILLCSDGVWEMVRDDELARILRETTSTAEACERIVRAANENGGEDNISVVLLDVSA
ncbi:MAG TPA: protein phosphatase 2C domain-containing protein [Ktedonobacterales bacterium]|nr:protein phosphatase 2C domain-containing protein [Ktedonobacterales bacterium]